MILNELIKLTDEVILDFITDWQKSPYCWLQEIDIQVELTTRFRLKLSETDRYITARHGHEPHKQNKFQRVTCEPYVKLTTRTWMHPDIVVWNDSFDENIRFINNGTYPIDIICEIKYSFEDPVAGQDEDYMRLITSLSSESKPNLALQLVFIQKPSDSVESVNRKAEKNNHLIIYEVYLPFSQDLTSIS
jgi:hypothetical protein